MEAYLKSTTGNKKYTFKKFRCKDCIAKYFQNATGENYLMFTLQMKWID